MKKVIFLLSVLLLLTACSAPVQNPQPPVESGSAASVPSTEIPEVKGDEFPNPGGQGMAIDAYTAILNSFGTPLSPDDPGYPEEFADAYIGEDNFLYVCVTDVSDPVTSVYSDVVSEPRILRFVEVEHSYQELFALQMALTKLEGLEFSFVGIDVKGNEVDLGIPDISKESEVWELMETQLPTEVRELFQELPVSIEEAEYATFG